MDHPGGWWQKATNFLHAVPPSRYWYPVIKLCNKLGSHQKDRSARHKRSHQWPKAGSVQTCQKALQHMTSVVHRLNNLESFVGTTPDPGWRRKPGWPRSSWLRDVLKVTRRSNCTLLGMFGQQPMIMKGGERNYAFRWFWRWALERCMMAVISKFLSCKLLH